MIMIDSLETVHFYNSKYKILVIMQNNAKTLTWIILNLCNTDNDNTNMANCQQSRKFIVTLRGHS